MVPGIPYFTNGSIKHQSFVCTQSNDQTVIVKTIQFSISHLFSISFTIKQFYLTLSGATTLDLSGPGSNDNEGVLCIPQSSKSGTSPSDISRTLVRRRCLFPLQRCNWRILQPQPTGMTTRVARTYFGRKNNNKQTNYSVSFLFFYNDKNRIQSVNNRKKSKNKTFKNLFIEIHEGLTSSLRIITSDQFTYLGSNISSSESIHHAQRREQVVDHMEIWSLW